MRHSNSGQGHGTHGEPQESLGQEEAELMAEEAEEQAKLEAESTREKLLAKAKTEKGKSIINQLYRPVATIGDGGTADALIDEAINGPRPDGKQHYKKAKDRAAEIRKALKNGSAKGDEGLLENELGKLENAIALWEKLHGK